MNKIDLKGKSFGRLKIIKDTGERSKCGSIIWLTRCVCGNLKKIRSSHLRSKDIKSCGCLNREKSTRRIRKIGKRNRGNKHPNSNFCRVIRMADVLLEKLRKKESLPKIDLVTQSRLKALGENTENLLDEYINEEAVKESLLRMYDSKEDAEEGEKAIDGIYGNK